MDESVDGDDAPGRTEQPAPPPADPPNDETGSGPSRRLLLAGGVGVGVVLAAGLGGGAALVFPDKEPRAPRAAPRGLLAAVAAERALIADLDATTGGSATVRRGIAQVRADHAAHLRVLEKVLARYDRPRASTSPAPSGAARTSAELRAAERAASRDAARRAAALDGALATLLASISACEATHVRLLA